MLVEDNVPVKKDQPIFRFDRRPYEYKVEQIQAQLAEARQNVKVLKTEVDVATQKTLRAKAELSFTQVQKGMFDKLAQEHAVKRDDIELWMTRLSTAEATRDEALAELERANSKYKSAD